MRGFKINHDYLTQRDYDLLKEIEESREKYGMQYVGKTYRFRDKNEDGTFSKEMQLKIFMEQRREFAQWKLKRIRKIQKYNQEAREYYKNMEVNDQIHAIRKEKRELYYEFKYNVRPTLDNYAQCKWKPFWKFYYDDHTKFKKVIACYDESAFIIEIEDVTYI